MDIDLLTKGFERIGARLRVAPFAVAVRPGAFTIDVGRDGKGEHFLVRTDRRAPAAMDVIAAEPRDRHLVLMVRDAGGKHKFLCGHDERSWFVAAVPESETSVRDVFTAKEALKPERVREAQAVRGLRRDARELRKTGAYVRQGEWFFVPAPGLAVDPREVHRREPVARSDGGKPHWCEFLYRTAGEKVYVSPRHPAGLTEAAYRQLVAAQPEMRRLRWRVMQRNAVAYAKGRIWHPDHRTIVLRGWHRVEMNTESRAKARENVVFLD